MINTNMLKKRLKKLGFEYHSSKEANLLYVISIGERLKLGNDVVKKKFSKSKSRLAWKRCIVHGDYDKIPLIKGEVKKDDIWNYD